MAAGAAEAASAATPAPPSFFQQRIIKLPDWAKELLGLDEDVDVEARDRAAAAVVAVVSAPPPLPLTPPPHAPPLLSGAIGANDAGLEVIFNPLCLAGGAVALEAEGPALLPG